MVSRIFSCLTLLFLASPLVQEMQQVPQGQTTPQLATKAMPQPLPQDPTLRPARVRDDEKTVQGEFRTSDRCVACHNGLKTSTGEDVSIGLQWQASLMANSGRDPYWQASIRRETLDHPTEKAQIEDECSNCHMAVQHFANRDAGRKTEVLVHLPLQLLGKGDHAAADGVTCSVCHQAEPAGLGTQASFNGNLTFAPAVKHLLRPEYGPYNIDAGHQSAMMTSTGGYDPMEGDHMRDAGLCGTCHTLYTKARGKDGKVVAVLPEQMPYLEWQHSDYAEPRKDNAAGSPVTISDATASGRAAEGRSRPQTCQECHMPEVKGAMAVTAIYGQPRDGMHRHVFVGGNFLMSAMLEEHRDDLAVEAQPEELHAQVQRTMDFLQTKSARVAIGPVTDTASGVEFEVHAQNLTGHKLPTAYPSRRVWLHVSVLDASGKVVFESGHLNADGSIAGNVNDTDPSKYEPHFREINKPEQIEIYEPILKNNEGHVTTGLLDAVGYLKDNRLLPSGFEKSTAVADVQVVGEAATDPKFDDKGSTVRYDVPTSGAAGPLRIEVELIYQPIGYRWAHNFEPYAAAEPKRLVRYYEQAAHDSALVLAHAAITR